MEFRETARVLLFDPEDRLLLVSIEDPSIADPARPGRPPRIWVTPGGRVESGEDALAAAHREILEETGLLDVAVGPVVWMGEQTLVVGGEPVRLHETFVVARTRETGLTDVSWSPEERRVIQAMRWWMLDELETTAEPVLPGELRRRARAVAEGDFGDGVAHIPLD